MQNALFTFTFVTCLFITYVSCPFVSYSEESQQTTINKHFPAKSQKPQSRPTAATSEAMDPIDKQEADCLNTASSTAAMIACADAAYAAWDKELNNVYSELMKTLPPTSKQLLKDSQLEWIKYRDKEFKMLADIYSHVQGSMYLPVCVDEHAKLVKARVIQLRGYLDLPLDTDN